jgi:transposase
MSAADSLPDDVETLQRLLRTRDAELARATAHVSSAEALIAHLKLTIEKMRRELYGQRSERKAQLLDQMELELEELKAAAAEDEPAADKRVCAFTRKKPSCKPFPAHLPRERVIMPGPTVCACCGSTRLAKLGEDVTETLEVVPRQWKVVQSVREKFTCRACEGISQAPAPFHVLPRGFAGPGLLAMILFEKYGLHQPLNRQAERYMREGVELSLSTLADQVGEINGRSADERLLVRRRRVVPLVVDLEDWMRAERGKLSRHTEVAKAMDYLLKRWAAFSRFLDDASCAALRSVASRGCLPAPTAAASVPRSCTR